MSRIVIINDTGGLEDIEAMALVIIFKTIGNGTDPFVVGEYLVERNHNGYIVSED